MSRVLPALWLAALVSTPAFAVPVSGPMLGTHGVNGTVAGADVADLGDIGTGVAGANPGLDGWADIALGDPSAGGGKAYVFYGPGPGYNAPHLTINGTAANHKFGYAVDGIGDLNNDGFDDFVVGAPGVGLVAGPAAGAVYVFYGPLATGVRAAATANAIIYGQLPGDKAGSSVQIVPDMSGDGIADLLIGAPGVATGAVGGGAMYIVRGGGAMPATLGAAGVTKLFSSIPGAALGTSVDGVGQYNLDAVDDAIAGAPGASRAFIVSGGAVAWGAAANIAGVSMRIDGPGGTGFGRSVSILGDLDGDLRNEVLIGAPNNGVNGSVFITGFALTGFPAFVASAGTTFGYNGILGGGNFGWDVSEAGDRNMDGIPDFAVSAPLNLGGRTYVKSGPGGPLVAGVGAPITAAPAPFLVDWVGTFTHVGGALDGGNDDNGDGIPDILVGARDGGVPYNTAGAF